MLSGQRSISHYSSSNTAIWLVMAFQAGVLNIGGFFAGHSFVSHVTGFTSSFGMSLVNDDLYMAFKMAMVPFVFLVGSMVSGFFVDIRLKLNKTPKYFITFGIIFVLTLLVLLAGISGMLGEFGNDTEENSYLLLMILCFICGIQNGTITVVSKSIVRTTHLTGITTDLGLGLIRMLYKSRIEIDEVEEYKANWMRIGIIISFVMGSAIGAILFSRFAFWGFLVPVAIAGSLFFLMLYTHLKNNHF